MLGPLSQKLQYHAYLMPLHSAIHIHHTDQTPPTPVLSTSGGEIWPFIAVEQACLTDSVLQSRPPGDSASESAQIAVLYGWYNALGFAAQAAGALCGGGLVEALQVYWNFTPLGSYCAVFLSYGVFGRMIALMYMALTPHCEAKKAPVIASATAENSGRILGGLPRTSFGLRRRESVHIVVRLCVMFALDAFAGAFIMQTWIAFWFDRVWQLTPARCVGFFLYVFFECCVCECMWMIYVGFCV